MFYFNPLKQEVKRFERTGKHVVFWIETSIQETDETDRVHTCILPLVLVYTDAPESEVVFWKEFPKGFPIQKAKQEVTERTVAPLPRAFFRGSEDGWLQAVGYAREIEAEIEPIEWLSESKLSQNPCRDVTTGQLLQEAHDAIIALDVPLQNEKISQTKYLTLLNTFQDLTNTYWKEKHSPMTKKHKPSIKKTPT